MSTSATSTRVLKVFGEHARDLELETKKGPAEAGPFVLCGLSSYFLMTTFAFRA